MKRLEARNEAELVPYLWEGGRAWKGQAATGGGVYKETSLRLEDYSTSASVAAM